MNKEQPHRSEQQEWTVAKVSEIYNDSGIGGLAKAITAALAAERERTKDAEQLGFDAVKEHRELSNKAIAQLEQQLLSAQAAIEEYRAFLELYFIKGCLRFPNGKDYRQAARDL